MAVKARRFGRDSRSGRMNKFTGYTKNRETHAEREARLDALVEAYRKANTK